MKVKLTTTKIVSRLRKALPEFKEEIDRKFIHELRSKGLIEFAGIKNFPNRLNPVKPYVASTFWFYIKDTQGYVKMINAIKGYLNSSNNTNNIHVRRDREDDIEWNHITSSSDPEFAREEDTIEFYLNRKEY